MCGEVDVGGPVDDTGGRETRASLAAIARESRYPSSTRSPLLQDTTHSRPVLLYSCYHPASDGLDTLDCDGVDFDSDAEAVSAYQR